VKPGQTDDTQDTVAWAAAEAERELEARAAQEADQTVSDLEQDQADGDQAAAEADQAGSDVDQMQADRDQHASDRDQAAADWEGAQAPTGTKAAQARETSREERAAVT
jgi:hypothetical protein